MQSYLKHLGQHCRGFWPVQCCSMSTKTTLNRFFSYAMLPGACCTVLHRALTCSMLTQEYWENIAQEFFLGQHYIEFWPVHCYPEKFKTTLNRTFSCALLSGASRTTLHRAFTYVMLFGVSWTTLHMAFICTILSQEYLLDSKNILKEKPYVVLSLRLQTTLDKKNPIQYCFNTLWTTIA